MLKIKEKMLKAILFNSISIFDVSLFLLYIFQITLDFVDGGVIPGLSAGYEGGNKRMEKIPC